jgi:hypothetical protein
VLIVKRNESGVKNKNDKISVILINTGVLRRRRAGKNKLDRLSVEIVSALYFV